MAQSAGVDDAEPMRQYLRRLDVAAPAPPVSLGVRSVLSTVGIVAQGAQRFFYTLVIGRVAGPALVGQVNSLFSLALFASLLWPTATGAAATKYVAAARGRGDVAGTRALAAFLARRTVVSALICAVPAVVVARLALGADVASMVALAGLVLAYSGYAFVRGLQFGTGRIPRATVWDLVISVGTLVGAVLVLVSTSPALLLAPFIVGYAAFAIQGWPRTTRTPLPPAVRREADAFVRWGVLGNLASSGFLQLSMVVAAASDTPERAGYYAVALSVATPASLFARSLSMVLFPAMAEAVGRGDLAQLRQLADLATRTLVTTMVPLFGVLALAAGPLVRLLFGSDFAEAAPLLVVLLVAGLLMSVSVAATNSLVSRSLTGQRVSVLSSTAGAVVGVLAWVALVPPLGVVGVAIGYLVGAVVIGCAPLGFAWSWDRHAWAGVVLRLVAGVGAIGGAVYVQHTVAGGLGADAAVVAGFLVFWLVLSGRESVAAVRLIRRAFTRPRR
jgi:O-antigen/teichoic acid export membrane protein